MRIALHEAGPDAPCVIIAHGFKGFMGWGMFPWIGDRLAAAGCTAARFDFTCNGADENGDFTHLDRFRQNTLSKEQDDLKTIVDMVASGAPPFGGKCRPTQIGLLGHSRGGGGVIGYAAGDERIAAVATMAAVARTDRFPQAARDEAERNGFVNVPNARTGQDMPVGVEYFRDAVRHDPCAAAAGMHQPLLLVHGTADESVPVQEGRELRAAAGQDVMLVEIEGAGHTFGAVHPFKGPTPHLERALAAVVEFFRVELDAD